MKLSKKTTFFLLVLLVSLNILIRYPLTLHEIGMDSFAVHVVANSLSTFGHANWWYHLTAILGLYPNTEISGVPFFLSALNQTSNVDMESIVFVYSVFLGILSAFTAYLAASEIRNDDIYKFFVAYGFSLSLGVLNYTTFTTPARGLFIVLLPTFISSLLKCYKSIKFVPLIIMISLTLIATHHLFYFLIIILFSFFISLNLNKIQNILKIQIPQEFISFGVIFCFIAAIAFSFFTGFLIIGSRYALLSDTFIGTYPRFIGILYITAIGGLIYVIFKPSKNYKEWFIIFCTLFLTPFIFEVDYFIWIIIIFIFLFAGIGLHNIYSNVKKINYKIIIVFLILSIIFSGFFQLYYPFMKEKRTNNIGSPTLRYTDESTYNSAIWTKENIDKPVVSNDLVTGLRASAASTKPFFLGYNSIDSIYGFGDDLANVTLQKGSFTSSNYWLSGPYSITSNYTESETYFVRLMLNKFEAFDVISKFNLGYLMENKKTKGDWIIYDRGPSDFLRLIYIKNSLIYDNGKIAVWLL